ncbi:substrate-binding periplasmic protein [Marinomonas sp. PE14-40]|uniref:substrate-binding periplasmic protein n=1 Tax=Marinomonas sp. PE14-40 TaxID=3060621 RepID=UPI003F66FD76
MKAPSVLPALFPGFVKASLLLIFLAFNLTVAARSAPLVFLADHFPPYEFANPMGKALGFDVEVIDRVFKDIDVDAQFKFVPWNRVINTVKKGEAAGYFSCAYKPEREAYSYYSDLLSTATQGIIVKRGFDVSGIRYVSDLKRLRIGTVEGYAANQYLKDADIEFEKIGHISNAFPMLSRERFDALFLSLEAGMYLASEAGLSDQLAYIPMQDIPVRKYYLCFSNQLENHKEIAEKFNKKLAEFREDGTYEMIHDRYR